MKLTPRIELRGIVIVAALLVGGAGCNLASAVKLRSPFEFGGTIPAPASFPLTIATGAKFTMRQSALGIGGTIADVLGSRNGSRSVNVRALDDEKISIDWVSLDATSTPEAGSIVSNGWRDASAALPPVFWKQGTMNLNGNSLVWLSPKSYADLQNGATVWQTLPPNLQLPPLAKKALTTFESLAIKLSKQASATSTSPFRLSKAADIAAYPLRINGSIEQVQAIRATGWFADIVVLKNPQTPLVLNVTIHPAALGALEALRSYGIDPATLGFEVTDITTK